MSVLDLHDAQETLARAGLSEGVLLLGLVRGTRSTVPNVLFVAPVAQTIPARGRWASSCPSRGKMGMPLIGVA